MVSSPSTKVIMSQQVVRLGYVGAGRFSQSRLLPAFKGIPGVELVVVSNSTPESSQRIAQEFGFQRTEDSWQELVKATDIDAVVIGTHPPLHLDACLQALDAEKHVLLLNAISPTLEEAKDMYEKAQEKPGLVSLVYPSQFYLREEALMRSLLEEGYVGQIVQVLVYWYTPYFGLGSQFEVAQRWFGEHTKVFAYRKGIDIEVPVTDQPPEITHASTNIVMGELESGWAITYFHSTVAGGTNLARIEVYGSEGVLVCYSYDQIKEGIYGAKTGETELHPIAVPARMQEAWTYPNANIPVEASFISAIRDGQPASPAIPRFWDGVKLLEFVLAWRYSIGRGSWCDLPLP
jgi:predicted dehydrogenase